MKVTIEISESSARMYRSMASMGRFCDSIRRLAEDVLDIPELPESLNEHANFTCDEIEQLKPSIMEIHYVLRNALVEQGVKPLWNQNQGANDAHQSR